MCPHECNTEQNRPLDSHPDDQIKAPLEIGFGGAFVTKKGPAMIPGAGFIAAADL